MKIIPSCFPLLSDMIKCSVNSFSSKSFGKHRIQLCDLHKLGSSSRAKIVGDWKFHSFMMFSKNGLRSSSPLTIFRYKKITSSREQEVHITAACVGNWKLAKLSEDGPLQSPNGLHGIKVVLSISPSSYDCFSLTLHIDRWDPYVRGKLFSPAFHIPNFI